ncbi:MAG: PspC domain-containing protein [Roseiflexaceae bacterium]
MEHTQLRRSSSDRMVAGVAGGLAALLKIDPVIVRVAFVILALINGAGAFLYLIMWVIVPADQSSAATPAEQVRENVLDIRESAERFVQRVRSMFLTA